MPKMVPILSIALAVVFELTNRVDVKEAHGCREYGFEHAVVQRLRRLHQHVEQGEVPGEAENDGGSSQTWRDRRLLHTSEGAHSAHTHTHISATRGYLHKHSGRRWCPALQWCSVDLGGQWCLGGSCCCCSAPLACRP